MKLVQSVLILMIFLLTAPIALAVEAVYILKVDGLGCPFCAYGIEKKLSTIKDVQTIDVDLKNARVIVTMDNDVRLDEQQAREAVLDAGFTLRSFSPYLKIKKDRL